jgi:MPBQ/MSBQ methyltransferase
VQGHVQGGVQTGVTAGAATYRRAALIRRYDRPLYNDPMVDEYYQGSDFFNFGYWTADTPNQKGACENLMERLLAFIPEKRGTVLDVACGRGATTCHLLRYYKPSRITGINISHRQLETSRIKVPGAHFVLMDAAKLGFPDATFDNVICVEAAFHFETRSDFVREVHRVLKPSGRVVLSDILVAGWAARLNPRIGEFNYVKDLQEYRQLYMRAGFGDVEVIDATRECWTAFYDHLWQWRREQFLAGRIARRSYYRMCFRNLVANAGVKRYLLVAATKS